MASNFETASKAAESWINTVSLVAKLGENGSVDEAYRLLLPPDGEPNWPNLLGSFNQHSEALRNAFGDLAALSDAPVKWEHGRGLSAIAGSPEHVYPHVWSSAHEAAHGIASLAIDLLVRPLEGIKDPHEQTIAAKQLLSERWKAIVIPVGEVALLQERIRRERAKLLATDQPDEAVWSEAKSPGEWQKELDIGASTWRRHVNHKKLVVERITTKKVRIRLDSLQTFTGGK